MRFFLLRFSLLLCACVAFSGCGKKGNLYLPDAPAAPAHSQPQK